MSLGKITYIKLGQGGYDDAMFGLTVGLETVDGSTIDFKGTWTYRSENAKWTVKDQEQNFLDVILFIKNLMEDSGVSDFNQLKGKPVDVQFNDNRLFSWRILKEVL